MTPQHSPQVATFKGAASAIFLLFFIAFLAAIAAADVILISPEEAVLPSQNAAFKFNTTDAAQNCTLIINGAGNKTIAAIPNQLQNRISSIDLELNPGRYNWSVQCNTNTSQVNSASRTLAIDVAPPEVKLLTPFTTFNTSTAALTYQPDDDNLKNCTLLVDAESPGVLKEVRTNISPASGKSNTFLIELQDRRYKWGIKCSDRAGNINALFYSGSFDTDTTPPSVLTLQPSSVITGTASKLALTTSENSECRYGSSLQNYSYMARLEITGAKQHQQQLSFPSDGAYAYYIICQDIFGNSMEPQKLEIAVHLLPTAKISLSDSSPLKAGVIEVNVQTSKNMGSPPTLTYAASGKEVPIALTGQNNVWKGNFLVEDVPDKKIATFSFSGIDTEGYTGTVITEGRSFVIDTIKPPALINLKAEEKNYSIALHWYLSSVEDVYQYKIYRSTSPSPTYLDLYAAVNGSQFVDSAVQDRVTYYYRVAAIDQAGNLGDLSETVYATARTADSQPESNATAAQQAETKTPPLPPNLIVEVNDAAKSVETVKLTIEGAVTTIASLSGKARELADITGAKVKAEAANKRLEEILVQLESLKREYKEANELRSLLKNVIEETKRIERETIKDIKIEAQIEDLPIVRKEQILTAIDKTFTEAEIGRGSRNSYASRNEKELQDLRIKTEAVIARIVKANGMEEEKTLITQSFTYAGIEAVQDSLAVVFVPKTVASSSKELSYPSGKPEVLQDDPVLKWGFLSIGPEVQKVSYMVNKRLSDSDVRSLEIVPLLNVNKIAEEESTPTGLSVLANVQKTGQFWIVLPGLLVVLALGGYYLITTPRRQNEENEKAAGETLQYDALKELDARLSTIQAEIDEELYPILTSIRNTLLKRNDQGSGSYEQSSDLSREKVITALISTVKNCLNSEETGKAKGLYPAIQLLYQSLSPEQKAKFSADCMWLYKQLNK